MSETGFPSTSESSPAPIRVVVFSDRANVRERVNTILGNSVGSNFPPLELVNFATAPAVMLSLEESKFDVAILDGEASPLGGIGLAYQIKNEITDPPKILLLLPRRDDAWLATWSRADAVYPLELDPYDFISTFTDLISDLSLELQ